MASGKKRKEMKAKKRARKAALRAQYAEMDDKERKELNPRVPCQRRKLERLRGEPMKARKVQPWWTPMMATMIRQEPRAVRSEE